MDYPQRLNLTLYEGEPFRFGHRPKHSESAVYSVYIWMLFMIEMQLMTAMAEAQKNTQGGKTNRKVKDLDLKKINSIGGQ